MATHKEACRALVRERLAPHFQHVAERLERHFDASYELIRATPAIRPDPASLIQKRKGPMVWKASLPVKVYHFLVQEYPLDFALTCLGVKPLSIIEHRQERQIRNMNPAVLRSAGLEIRQVNNGREEVPVVYDPQITSRILSRFFNGKIEPSEIISAIQESISDLGGMWFHQLLGYPEQMKTNPDGTWKTSEFGLHVKSVGTLLSIMPIYATEWMACATYLPEQMNLESFASAAAIVEEIRQSSLRIESYARILRTTPEEILVNREVRIKRQKSGDWSITESEWDV